MANALYRVLAQQEAVLKNAWFDRMLDSYPQASRKYFERVNKEFSNPVGANLHHSLSALFSELISDEADADRIKDHLQMILRIKAVQDVLPSQAVSFIPALKQIIERVCKDNIARGEIPLPELMDFYTDLDTVALLAFDIYSESRELIYDLRLRQIKETNDILVKADLIDMAMSGEDMSGFMGCTGKLLTQETTQTDIDKGV